MNKTVLIWMAIAALLAVRSFVRPSYAVGLYMLTFFAAPTAWWWGDLIEDYRWNFYAGVLLLVTLIATRPWDAMKQERPLESNAVPILLLMALNAIVVHFAFAVNPAPSLEWLTARLKFILLFFMLQYSIRDLKDYRIVCMALTLGMGYLGYEATINERGSFSSGRLEGIGAAGVTSSNQLSSLLITGLPISIGLVFTSMSKWLKLVVLICGGLTFNVVLFCNSRGAFLGLIAGGVAFLLMASGPARKKAIGLVAGTAIVTFVLLGDPRIVERFLTIFTSEGQRDSSAQGRIVFWTAAREMLADYPFGSGGNSFSEGRGWRYMPGAQASGTDQDKAGETRAIHNGYLTEAVDWGVQGLALALLFLGAIGWTLRRGRKLALAARDPNAVMVFGCIAAGLVGWMVSSFFGDYINDEWGFWAGAIAYSYLRVWVFARAAEEVPRESAPAPVPAFSPAWPRLTP